MDVTRRDKARENRRKLGANRRAEDRFRKTDPADDERSVSLLQAVWENRNVPGVEPMADGRVGFLYLDKNSEPLVALRWQLCFKRIREKYAASGGSPMPVVTPHVCRHTFCSNMAKSGMNLKKHQYLMGNSDVGITLNTCINVDLEDVIEGMQNVCHLCPC